MSAVQFAAPVPCHSARDGEAVRGGTLRAGCRGMAALFLTAAAIIHLGFAPAHLGEHLLYGLFFAGVAVFQAAGAAAAARGRSRFMDLAVDGNTVIVVLWALSRFVGPMIAPHAEWAEPVGFADGLCTVLEVGAIGMMLLASRLAGSFGFLERRVPRKAAVAALVALGLALLPLVGHALSGVEEHEAHEIHHVHAAGLDHFH